MIWRLMWIMWHPILQRSFRCWTHERETGEPMAYLLCAAERLEANEAEEEILPSA